MKKELVIIWMIPLLLILACAPTPEKEAVVQQNQNKMLEQAQLNMDNLKDQDLYQRLSAPVRYENRLTSTEGRLSVFVDAEVILPSAELPIARVSPEDFSVEQILEITSALVPKEAKFVSGFKTKGFYNRQIMRLQWAIDHWDNGGEMMYDMLYPSIDAAKSGLSSLIDLRATAPESFPEITPPKQFSDDLYQLYTTTDQSVYSELFSVSSRADYGVASFQFRNDHMASALIMNLQRIPSGLSAEKAEENALSIAKSVPLMMDFALTAAFPSEYIGFWGQNTPCYHFIFTRVVNGVAETVTNVDQTLESYDKPWGYEKIHMIVDENGLAGFQYDNPYSVEVLYEKTNLMEFDSIITSFEKMILFYNNRLMDGTAREDTIEYHISTIKLGLASMKEENSDTGLLVPAWDFLGYEQTYNEKGEPECFETNELKSFLTLNAIDGSIIHRQDQ